MTAWTSDPLIEPLVGSCHFVVRLTAQGFVATMVDEEGDPAELRVDAMQVVVVKGEPSPTASEAIRNALARYPFTFDTSSDQLNIMVRTL